MISVHMSINNKASKVHYIFVIHMQMHHYEMDGALTRRSTSDQPRSDQEETRRLPRARSPSAGLKGKQKAFDDSGLTSVRCDYYHKQVKRGERRTRFRSAVL